MSKEALIIFTKNPELGKVKTRLARSTGDEMALEIYRKLIAHTQKEIVQSGIDLIVYYSSMIEANDGWKATSKRLQSEGDLGNKMSEAFKIELEVYDKVCIIGTDCGELATAHIQQAFAKLADHDFVIGPANDGGYYLLGMKSFHPEIFQDVDWSTDQVLIQTMDKINALQETFYLLPELIDVDTIEDWDIVKGNFQ